MVRERVVFRVLRYRGPCSMPSESRIASVGMLTVRPGPRKPSEVRPHQADCLFALGLHRLLGLTYGEIATRMGISTGSARRYCSEALTYPSLFRTRGTIDAPEDIDE